MSTTVPSSTSRRMRAFLKWMAARQIQYSGGLEFIHGDGVASGIGVKALYDFHEGDLIATIPKHACLTLKTSGAAELIEEAGLAGGLGLTVALMYERSREERSPWYEYLQVLPSRQELPIVWKPPEVEKLLGTELYAVVQEDRKLIQKDWQECICSLTKTNPRDFPEEYFTLEQYFCAKTLVASRAFEVDEYHGYGLVPLADLFNHKTGAEDVHFTDILSDLESDVENSDCLKSEKKTENEPTSEKRRESPTLSRRASKRAKLERNKLATSRVSCTSTESWNESTNVLEMILVKNVSSGSEIFNTYGDLSNAGLLHRYGFTELGNPYDIVNMDFALIMEYCTSHFSKQHVRRRARLWRRYGSKACKSRNSEYFEITACGKPQIELLFLLYLVHLSADAFERLDCSLNDGAGSDNFSSTYLWTERIIARVVNRTSDPRTKETNSVTSRKRNLGHAEVEDLKQVGVNLQDCLLTKGVCEGLLWLCSRREKLYGTSSIEEDQILLKTVSPSEQAKLFHALRLRLSERYILRNLYRHVCDKLRGF